MTAWFIVIVLCVSAAPRACIEATPPGAPYHNEDSCLEEGLAVFLGYRPPHGWRAVMYRCELRPLER